MNDIHSNPPILPEDQPQLTRPASPSGWRQLLTRRWLIVIGAVLALLLLAWLLTPKAPKAPGGRFANAGPMPVATAAAHTGSMPIIVNGLGTVTPITTVTVQSQVSGQITQIAFKEGQTVKRGDLLIQIDPRPYQVALEQAEGALARDKALLANARTDLDRYTTLFAQDSIAEQQLATQRSLVAQDIGTIKTDQGQIDAAKLNLIYSHITSPIDGRAGLQQVTLGNYVTPAEPNGLVVVTQLQPITVVFALPEDQIPPILEQMHAGTTLAVTAYDRGHQTQLASGTLQSIDSQIDPTTGTVKLKAVFANADERLFPNQFVNVDLMVNTLQGATLIPQAAVQRGAPGTYVYVVNADNSVNVRMVTLGPGDATNVAVTQGLKPGEVVVIDGADRLKDGAKVVTRQGAGANAPSQGQVQGPARGQGSGQKHQQRRGDHGTAADQGGQPPSQ
jgi:membrane fusion protein, multidrug efflux system